MKSSFRIDFKEERYSYAKNEYGETACYHDGNRFFPIDEKSQKLINLMAEKINKLQEDLAADIVTGNAAIGA